MNKLPENNFDIIMFVIAIFFNVFSDITKSVI